MHPVLLQTNYFTINTFWVFFIFAILTATFLLIKFAPKQGLKINFFSQNFWKFFLVAFLGARIGGIIENYHTYFSTFQLNDLMQVFFLWDKGYNIWIGVICFIVYLFWKCKKTEQSFLKWLDLLAPILVVTFGIIALGSFFDGTAYGNETSLPWGVNFESPAIKYTVPIHPSQIYSFLYSGLLVIAIFLFQDSKKFNQLNFNGLLGLSTISIYSILKFLEECTRGDDTWTILGIRISQIFFPLLAIISGVFIFLLYNKRTKKPQKKSN
ncbi:prolipoprotein diacylglyceryl transferase [Patescibacteria group bacterium]|nr:prolipoprotein diacylglyceryl transferase [Patescibacteria group bacterium]